jgi:hypothetical protein
LQRLNENGPVVDVDSYDAATPDERLPLLQCHTDAQICDLKNDNDCQVSMLKKRFSFVNDVALLAITMGNFVNMPFHQLDASSTWVFVNLALCQLVISPT